MFTRGTESRFVNYYSSGRHFREDSLVEEYRSTLLTEIESNITVCPSQLFIFDEARRFPSGLLDSLVSFFDPGSPDSKKAANSVFLFIYEGDEPVVDWAVELNEKGINRHDITLKEAEERIVPYINQDKSLQDSVLVRKGLIQHHLPFLPLEVNHVRKCIKDAILELVESTREELGTMDTAFCASYSQLREWVSTQGLEARFYFVCSLATKNKISPEAMESLIDQVHEEIIFYPQSKPTFATFGCKKINSKVRALLDL